MSRQSIGKKEIKRKMKDFDGDFGDLCIVLEYILTTWGTKHQKALGCARWMVRQLKYAMTKVSRQK